MTTTAIHPKNASLQKKRFLFLMEIIFFFLLYGLLLYFLRNRIPDAPVIINMIGKLYGTYGYDLIFLGALLEGTFVVGFYVPGSLIVLMGAALARSGVVSFPLVILFGTLGLTLGYTINYLLGRYGWYKLLKGFGFEKGIVIAEKKLNRYQDKALFIGYIMPSTGSLLSTASGIMKVPFKKFVIKSLVIQTFWSLILGGCAYLFGNIFIQGFLNYFGVIALFVIAFYILKKLNWKKLFHKKP